MVWILFGWSGNFWMVGKLSEWSENFPNGLKTFLIVWNLSGRSGNFLDGLETSVWSGNFSDDMETFQMVLKLLKWSGKAGQSPVSANSPKL